ncbi:hypothetical protein MHR_0448 [Mesomycoplasma hyorhinis HUB-1]|nr:hypothetical protein MHR_0448 [Mesomycoplasma hyorhinis HUB-1]
MLLSSIAFNSKLSPLWENKVKISFSVSFFTASCVENLNLSSFCFEFKSSIKDGSNWDDKFLYSVLTISFSTTLTVDFGSVKTVAIATGVNKMQPIATANQGFALFFLCFSIISPSKFSNYTQNYIYIYIYPKNLFGFVNI